MIGVYVEQDRINTYLAPEPCTVFDVSEDHGNEFIGQILQFKTGQWAYRFPNCKWVKITKHYYSLTEVLDLFCDLYEERNP